MKGKFGAFLEYEDHHEASKGRFDSYGVYGIHGVAWQDIEGRLCLWEFLEFNWIKNKHVKKKKGYVKCLWPYGLVISLILVQLGSFKLCLCSVFRHGRNGLVSLESIIEIGLFYV